MKKKFIKILLITGIILSVLGSIIFTIAMSVNGWDFGVLATHVAEAKTVEIQNEQELQRVTAVKIDVSTADVKILYHDEQKIIVKAFDLKTIKGELTQTIDVSVEENNLEIKEKNIKTINLQTGIKGKTEIEVVLPWQMAVSISATLTTGKVHLGNEGEDCTYQDVKINLFTGDVKLVGNVNCKDVALKTTTGDIYFNGNLTCNSLKINSSTGDVFVNGEIKTGILEKESTTGDFVINKKIEARKIEVEQGTGHFKCNAFITANEIEIDTSTGDVCLKLLGFKNDYSYVYEITTGRSNIPAFSNGNKRIEIETTTGDIEIYFEQ